MYVLSDKLIEYWNENKVSFLVKKAFIRSFGLDPGKYKFTTSCAFTWENKESTCTATSWDDFLKYTREFNIIDYTDYVCWSNNKKHKTTPIKEDKNVNRLQKQKTQIDRGDFPEGNRIKGRTCKVTIGVGHLSYQAVKS